VWQSLERRQHIPAAILRCGAPAAWLTHVLLLRPNGLTARCCNHVVTHLICRFMQLHMWLRVWGSIVRKHIKHAGQLAGSGQGVHTHTCAAGIPEGTPAAG